MNGYGYLIVGIVVVAIIALLATNKTEMRTLAVGLKYLISEASSAYQLMMAAALMSIAPLIIVYILCEKNFVRYMNIQRGNFFAIFTSPIAMVFLIVAVGTILFSIYNQSKINKREAAHKAAMKAK